MSEAAPAREAALRGLERGLGHRFADRALLERALTHASRAHEDASGALRHNEPLEFLGDAILGFVVAELLHRRDPDGPEGGKTQARAHLVSRANLARHAGQLGLGELLALGRGEEKTGGRHKQALWADAFEAVVAALYLDGGLRAAQRFVEARFGPELLDGARLASRDHKSTLQELLQGRGEPAPVYDVIREQAGPGNTRSFRVRCLVGTRPLSEGEGATKKEAQQAAARAALQRLARPSA
jgi:ribonuclease III